MPSQCSRTACRPPWTAPAATAACRLLPTGPCLAPRPAPGLFQLASALEIVHAAAGLVGGSPVTAAMQWVGRSNVWFGVVAAVPEVQGGLAVGAMILAWALSEVIRYPWYAASLAGACPHWLTWLRCDSGAGRGGEGAWDWPRHVQRCLTCTLTPTHPTSACHPPSRYTAFIPLYPVGVVGEMWAVYSALPLIKQRRLRSVRLPNAANWGFDYHLFLAASRQLAGMPAAACCRLPSPARQSGRGLLPHRSLPPARARRPGAAARCVADDAACALPCCRLSPRSCCCASTPSSGSTSTPSSSASAARS